MKAIFLDVTSLTPKQVEKAVRVARQILLNNEEDVVIVSIGYGRFGVSNRWKLCNELCLQRFEVSPYLDLDKGVEVQEWINHHVDINRICIVSNEEDVRPLENFRIRFSKFFLGWKIRKMLRVPYINKMSKQIEGNMRKMF